MLLDSYAVLVADGYRDGYAKALGYS